MVCKWDRFNAMKPAEGVNHPDDIAALTTALSTIGDYKLKSAPDYKVPKHLRESTLKKYKTLLTIRKKQFDLRHEFNVKIHNLREQKVELRDYLVKMRKVLDDVQSELPTNKHIAAPEVIELMDYNFPEKNLELVLDLPPEMVEVKEKERFIVVEPTGDLLEKEVLPCLEYGLCELEQGQTVSPWETELKQMRLKRKLFQQKHIVACMDEAVVEFDKAVEEAFNERLKVIVDAKFLDQYILTLNQELLILKKFEAGENKLSDEIRVHLEETLDIKDVLREMNNKIELHKHEIEALEEHMRVIQRRFLDVAMDSKFYDFLRRIFKKKYKPPKKKDADDDDSDSESSSSSSSSDDDEEAGSIDSRDVGPIRLDESVCPKGCDQALYDLTFALRNERHADEQAIKDHNAGIEGIKKDIEHVNKKYKLTEAELNKVQDELEAYQREKQQKLNQIICTVILKFNQLQHITPDNQLNNIKDTLVFSKQVLMNLYRRVGQLQNETLQQKAKHATNVRHLGRMKTDCKYMERQILQLYEDVSELMRRKFGKNVDIDEIQEMSLKRMVFDLRMSMLDIRNLYEDEMKHWREKIAQKQKELSAKIQENTSKLEILALLNAEKTELMNILRMQEEKRVHLDTLSMIKLDSKSDLYKLANIVSAQRRELQVLSDEIQMLKTKGLQRPKPQQRQMFDEDLEEEEIELMELDESDDIIEVDFNLKRVHVPHFSIIKEIPESHIVAKEVLAEFFDEIDLDVNARQSAEEAIEHILNQVSITSLIDKLLSFIPRGLTEHEENILEITAEKLYGLKPEASEDSIDRCARLAVEEIVDNTMLTIEATEEISYMLKDLVEQVPLQFILEESSITRIIDKIINSATAIDKDALVRRCMSITSTQRKQMEEVLRVILEQVYGTGMDYLFYITF